MKKVLVLDPFTNGHEAAMVFIQRQGWNEEECEIIFCGSHQKMFERLIEGTVYAVVPIHNSTPHVGEITEVTDRLNLLLKSGCLLEEKDRFDLPVSHCLLTNQNIYGPEALELVLSHPKAISQCSKYLSSIGITPDKLSMCNSTAQAASVVSKLCTDAKVGVIATKSAAKAHGLKVLAEGIQDIPDNKTTFILLYNMTIA